MLFIGASLAFKPPTQVRTDPSSTTRTVPRCQTDNEEHISTGDWLDFLIQPLTATADGRPASGTLAVHLPPAGIDASSDLVS